MKNKKPFLRMMPFLMLCFLLCGNLTAHAEKKPWVKVEGNTMTFSYGDKDNLGENEYDLNEGDAEPAWNKTSVPKSVTKVVFDTSFKDARPESCAYWFSFMENLTDIEGIENLNTSKTTNMYMMFNWCPKLASIDVSHFETANVTNMGSMFSCCYSLQYIFAGEGFTTANVTESEDMFAGCTLLRGAIGYQPDKGTAEYANTENGYFTNAENKDNVKYYWLKYADGTATFYYSKKESVGDGESYMMVWAYNDPYSFENEVTKLVFDTSFSDARPLTCSMWFTCFMNLTTIEGMENLNTSETTNMSEMFYQCEKLKSLDLSHFNTSKVTDMSDMFWNCESLTDLNISSFNTSNVTDMSGMFCSCDSLTSLDVSHFNTSNVTNMSSMFYDCKTLTTLDVSHFDTSKTTDMMSMFRGGGWNLRSLDLSNFNTSNVENFNQMFSNCFSLPYLDLSNFNTPNLKNMYYMFLNCGSMRYIFVGDGFNIDNVKYGEDVFASCYSLTGAIEYQNDKTDFKYANKENGYFTDVKYKDQAKYIWIKHTDDTFTLYFGKKDKLEENEEYMTGSYRVIEPYTSGITKVVFDESFKEATPSSCCGYFAGFTNLTTIEGLENLNTSKAVDLNYMFYSCEKLTSLDLSKFNTPNVLDMSYMFYDCPNLKSLYLSDKFDASKVKAEDCKEMFTGSNPTVYCRPNEYGTVKANKLLDGRNFMAYADINPAAEYGTICVPVGSDLNDGDYAGFDKLYSVSQCKTSDGYALLKEEKQLQPGVAYVYHRNLTADDTKAAVSYKPNDSTADAPSSNALLKGTFVEATAPVDSYVLNEDGLLHLVSMDGIATVNAYEAYLQAKAESGTTLPNTLSLKIDSETGINEILDTNDTTTQPHVFDLMGRQVNTLVKGRVYIKNGKKMMND